MLPIKFSFDSVDLDDEIGSGNLYEINRMLSVIDCRPSQFLIRKKYFRFQLNIHIS